MSQSDDYADDPASQSLSQARNAELDAPEDDESPFGGPYRRCVICRFSERTEDVRYYFEYNGVVYCSKCKCQRCGGNKEPYGNYGQVYCPVCNGGPSGNTCLECGDDMGPSNPRQLCGKIYCRNK